MACAIFRIPKSIKACVNVSPSRLTIIFYNGILSSSNIKVQCIRWRIVMKNRGFFSRQALLNLTIVAFGILLYLTLSNFDAVKSSVDNFIAILSPFIVGIAIAYLLNMPMRFFEEKVFKRFRNKKIFAILVTYVLAIFIFTLLLGMFLPQLIDSVTTLLSSIQRYFDNLNLLIEQLGEALHLEKETTDAIMLSYKDIVDQIVTYVRGILPQILSLTMRIGTGIISALTALIASIYMLGSKKKLTRQYRKILYAILPQHHADTAIRVGRLSNDVFSGFIGGKLLDSAIIGVICFVFMFLMNLGLTEMPYALLISVIVGVTNIIPFFGPFIGAIPSALILLMVDPWSALWFVIFIIVLQQFDGNYLGPKILGETTGLPAIWVLIAIIVGGGLFGFIGMILGVPTFAVLYTLMSDFVENRLNEKGLTDADVQED